MGILFFIQFYEDFLNNIYFQSPIFKIKHRKKSQKSWQITHHQERDKP
jgi:hypothetical protein